MCRDRRASFGPPRTIFAVHGSPVAFEAQGRGGGLGDEIPFG